MIQLAAKGEKMATSLMVVVFSALSAQLISSLVHSGTLEPRLWPLITTCCWILVMLWKGWSDFGPLTGQAIVSLASAAIFMHFLEQVEPDFSGWGSVYYFCGTNYQFCTCSLNWNALGWYKASVLWLFVIATAAGVRHLLLSVTLGGMLPGEEHIDREVVLSIAWRLIPYWLNRWEQAWGAECTSMLFELPHFALELLVVLPLIQVICRRLRPLLAPCARVPTPLRDSLRQLGIPLKPPPQLEAPVAPCGAAVAAGRAGGARPECGRGRVHACTDASQLLVLDVAAAEWQLDHRQLALWPRLRANGRPLAFCAILLAVALANSLVTPRALEAATVGHAQTAAVRAAHLDRRFSSHTLEPWEHWLEGGLAAHLDGASPSPQDARSPLCAVPEAHMRALTMRTAHVHGRRFDGAPCGDAHQSARPRFHAALAQAGKEVRRMASARHARMVAAVEVALIAMRLACEGFFVLLAAYAAYLLRAPPRPLAALVRAASFASYLFQSLVLYVFPVVCWRYRAGVVFSTFVSFLFWGPPAMLAWERIASAALVAVPRGLTVPTPDDVERAAQQCSICWTPLTTAPPAPSAQSGSTATESGSAAPDTTEQTRLPPGHSNSEDHVRRRGAGAEQWPACGGAEGGHALATGVAGARAGSAPLAGGGGPDAERSSCGTDASEEAISGAGTAACAACGGRGGCGREGGATEAPHAPAAATPRPPRRRWPLGLLGAGCGDEHCSEPRGHRHAGAAAAVEVQGSSSSSRREGGVAPIRGGPPEGEGEDVSGGGGGKEIRTPLPLSACAPATAVALPCGHVFHFSCVSHWLQQCTLGLRARACPLCQRALAVDVRWSVWHLLARPPPGASMPAVEPADHGEDVAAVAVGVSDNHIPIDFLCGLMPGAATLHLQHHPYAPRVAIEVPLVTRWRHSPGHMLLGGGEH